MITWWFGFRRWGLRTRIVLTQSHVLLPDRLRITLHVSTYGHQHMQCWFKLAISTSLAIRPSSGSVCLVCHSDLSIRTWLIFRLHLRITKEVFVANRTTSSTYRWKGTGVEWYRYASLSNAGAIWGHCSVVVQHCSSVIKCSQVATHVSFRKGRVHFSRACVELPLQLNTIIGLGYTRAIDIFLFSIHDSGLHLSVMLVLPLKMKSISLECQQFFPLVFSLQV